MTQTDEARKAYNNAYNKKHRERIRKQVRERNKERYHSDKEYNQNQKDRVKHQNKCLWILAKRHAKEFEVILKKTK